MIMNARVKFLGGAGSVTGSKFLLEIDDFNLLIDCGLFQGTKELRLRNWNDLPVNPANIDAVILTHAHIDHSGYLPLLFKNGFKGQVHCTEPTAELIEILLLDSAKLHEEEAAFANKKGYSKHDPARALYTVKDAKLMFPFVTPHPVHETFRVNDQIEVRFFHAGHILGAASVEVLLYSSQGVKRLVFSGDIGPTKNPLHLSPEKPTDADILFIESTYGGRNHSNENIEQQLADLLSDCKMREGCLIIPAFSLGRTQLILYLLWKLFQSQRPWPIYVDSPMAISVTGLYKRFSDQHRIPSTEFSHPIFDAPFIHYVTEQSKSRLLNTMKKQAIIISASGMATGGRILHHLYHRLPNKQDTILFSGFQAEGSRGSSIVSGEPSVRIFGIEVPVRARIEQLNGLSAHADHMELMDWVEGIDKPPKMTFVVHGEADGAHALKKALKKKHWNAVVPHYLESFSLFDHI